MAPLTRKTVIEFRRESNRNYMIVRPGDGEGGRGTVRMLSGNPIRGLLAFQEKVFNGETLFCYDITSKQPLKRILDSRDITGTELKSLLTDLLGVLGEMERFFLDEDELMLDADMIYVDPDTFKSGWCVIPGAEGNFPEGFREFSQYLLDHINNNDSDAVVLAFGVFRQSRKENFGLEDIERELQKNVNTDHFRDTAPVVHPALHNDNIQRRSAETAVERHDAKDSWKQADKETGASPKVSPLYYLLVVPLMLLTPVIVCFRYGFAGIFVYGPMIAAADIVIGAAGILLIRVLIIKPQKNKSVHPSGLKKEKAGKRSESADERTEREELEIIFKKADDPGISGRYDLSPEDPAGGRERVYGSEDPPCDPADDDAFRTVLLTAQPVEFSRRKLVSLSDDRVIPVPYFPFLIGKNKNICDFCPDDEGVSRLHLRIDNEQDEYLVTDLNSTNGTYINGRLLEPDETSSIKPGDEIRIAAGRYRFE